MRKKLFFSILGCILITLPGTFSLTKVVAEKEGPEVYLKEIQPMTTLECGRCHYGIFSDIRDKGGRHQIPCSKCHKVFHTYRPGRKWKDVVPDCKTCHDTYHGPGFPNCLKCHENAHAPSHSLNVRNMVQDCRTCHGEVGDKLSGSEEGHAFLQCVFCHADTHGYIPTCQDCHEAGTHSKEMLKGFKSCLDCHGDAHVLKLRQR
jgi:hypothetical protein